MVSFTSEMVSFKRRFRFRDGFVSEAVSFQIRVRFRGGFVRFRDGFVSETVLFQISFRCTDGFVSQTVSDMVCASETVSLQPRFHEWFRFNDSFIPDIVLFQRQFFRRLDRYRTKRNILYRLRLVRTCILYNTGNRAKYVIIYNNVVPGIVYYRKLHYNIL